MNYCEAAASDDWVANEFGAISLGDSRLNQRAIYTISKLAEKPNASINQACGDWKSSKAAYRMFDNGKVTTAKLIEPHQGKTVSRIQGQARVLVLQDTSYLNFNDHKNTTGLGSIGRFNTKRDNSQGLVMHTAVAVSPSGIPLGILSQKLWARENEKRIHPGYREPEDRESKKWFECFGDTISLLPDPSKVVTVTDREGDIYEFLFKIRQFESHFLIRANWNRVIRKENCVNSLWNQADTQPICGEYEIEVTETKGKEVKKRKAKMGVRYDSMKILPPGNAKYTSEEELTPIEIYAVYAKEIDPPVGADPVEWLLLSSIEVKTIEDAYERIFWYSLRWQIENFHKILKSGCGIEECELEDGERLKKVITIYSIIAWRLHWITHMGRQAPDAPCTVAFEEHEWKALYYKNHRTLPKNIPAMAEMVRCLAMLGGFLGRKGDGYPGIKSIWRGWERLTDLAEGWLLASGAATSG